MAEESASRQQSRKTAFSIRSLDKRLPLLFLASFAALVVSGVHGFSTGCWNDLVPDTLPSYSRRALGTDRPIRADEWNVSTPQVLAQCAAPGFFPRVNPRVGGGTDMFLATPCNPVWDWTVPGQFHNWGFFLFGAERGLAWNWWCRFLGIPLFAYLFFLGWLGRDRLLSATAALAVSLGAPTQWWDTTLPYILLYFFASLVFLGELFRRPNGPGRKTFAAAGLFVSLSSYAFAGYPVWELLLLPPFVALAWETARSENRETAGGPRPARARPFWFLAAALALVAAEFLYFSSVHAETLRIVAGSAYPGGRVCMGGSFPAFLRHAGLDVVSVFLPYGAFRPDLASFAETNACRAARFFVPGTALLSLVFFRRRFALRLAASDAVLAAWGAAALLWSAVPFPRWLAKATGFWMFPAHRAEVAAGFVFLLLAFRLFSRAETPPSGRRAFAAAVAAAASAAALAALLLPGGLAGFSASRSGIVFLLAGVLIVAAVSWGLAAQDRRFFCGGYLVLSLAGGLAVHPLSRGLSPLRDKELAALVREVDARDPGRWMGNISPTGNFLLAQGLDCLPGTQQYADPGFWKALDPDGSRERNWNRYAHRLVDVSPDEPSLIESPTVDSVRFSVNERQLRALGVRHLVWSGRKLREPWLKYEGRSRLHFVYTVLPAAAAGAPSPDGP
jgi:hypothetical protein